MAAMVSAPAQRGRPETVGRSEGDRPLPVLPVLEPLFPTGGLRRGSAVAVHGSASLLLALLAGPSRRGAWCAVVGLPGLGLVAAAEAGVELERLALVPDPGRDWAAVAAALLDAMEVVVVAPRGRVPDGDVRRLAARARQRGAVLVPYGSVAWPGAELRLSVGGGVWEGLGDGSGRLRSRRVVVRSEGRGSAARLRELSMWLPAPDGEIRPAPTLHAVLTPPDLSPAGEPTAGPPHLRAVPDLPTPPASEAPTPAATPAPASPSDEVVRTPSIAALWQDATHRPGSRAPVGRRVDDPTHPRPAGPPRRGARIAGPPPPTDGGRRDPRPRPAGPPVPAGRPAPVGGGPPVVPSPPPTAGPPRRPAIPAEVLARLRPASTLPRPPRRAAEG
jgi:hypothetical protein